MPTYYKATFSDGTVLKRSTASRKYTHAWRVRIESPSGNTWSRSGFCGSQALAERAANGLRSRATYTPTLAEVAPTVEITRKEYTAKDGSVRAGRAMTTPDQGGLTWRTNCPT